MKKAFTIASIITAVATAQAQVTGAGTMTFTDPGGQSAQHAWIDVSLRSLDLSFFVFGWDRKNPQLWVEGFSRSPLRLGSVSLTPGAFFALQAGSRQVGPALTIEVIEKSWALNVPLYYIAENRQQPTLFIPAARLQLPERNRLRFGIEGSLVAQGDWHQVRLGPTVCWQIDNRVCLRFAYLKGTTTDSGNQLRTVLNLKF